MKYYHNKFKVLLILLTITVLIVSSSSVSAQTTKVTDKFGNELVVLANTETNSVKRIYRVNAPLSRYSISVEQINKGNIEQLGKSIVKDYEDILDISSDDLKAYRTKKGKDSVWHLGFRQLYNDVPVWGSFVRYTIESQGVVTSISADVHPDIKLSVDATISVDNALATAIKAFEVDSTDTIIVRESPSLFIYPKKGKESVSYHLIYKVDLLSYTPSLNLMYLVDAHSGEIVEEMNKRRDVIYNNNGTVSIGHWAQNPTDSSPSSYNEISGVDVEVSYAGTPEGDDETDANGDYDIDWSGPYRQYKLEGEKVLLLSGSYAAVQNVSTTTHTYYFYPSVDKTHDWTYTVDETNVFHHVNEIHDYIVASPFNHYDMNYQMKAYVRQGSGTNGASDGTDIWFGTYDSKHWARSSDVVYHEYTHCIIYQLYGDWIEPTNDIYSEAYAMDEGLADYYAATINDEARVGEYVSLPSYRNLGIVRTMDVYIEDSDIEAAYKNGMIVAGAVWDMRESSSISDALADELLFDGLDRNPDDFSELLVDILSEDDTDADLSNGTPHITDILYSFENHEIYTSHPDVPPAAPKNLSVSGGWLENPTLSWDANTEPDLDEYNIYRAAPEHSFIYEATTSNTSWVDTEVLLGPPLGLWRWYVKAVDDDDNVSNASNIASAWGVDKMIAEGREFGGIPTAFSLEQNYPNPFNPETNIQFGLPNDSNVKLQIFNLQGQIVATLVDGALSAGYHTATFDATTYPSGIYFYKIAAGNFTDIKRMLLVK